MIKKGKEFQLERGQQIAIGCAQAETPAVHIAAENLRKDLERVLDAAVTFSEDWEKADILIGTLGISRAAESLLDAGKPQSDKEPQSDKKRQNERKLRNEKKLWDENGYFRKEAYIQAVSDGKLVIAGTDRRGTVYGIYEFCEMLGVSPWYFWGDVPVRRKERFRLPGDYEKADHPSVEYRGIFINDEEELEHWAQLYMGEDTIGVRTYEKLFELLLRLKGNYIWPAMHVNSFNVKKENGALAERMGIVVGTSHCDMLMRSNNREWLPWLAGKGYEDVQYDYSIEGRNREILNEYWRESVWQNREFEVSYTLGMRGIHDSGFETSMLKGETEEERKKQKIALLETIMENQERILSEELENVPLKLFIPYKEVLELYDAGLRVPDDLTLVWSNDNYGYIRRYPSGQERKRAGGNGIYYHNSYWSPPGRSYLFLCSIPLAHTRYELMKAWQEGIRKLWILNVGALKPLEMELEFFLRLGWEAGRPEGMTADVDDYVSGWVDRNFTGGWGKELGPLLNRLAQIANVRKLEMMEDDVFSQTSYGDEGAVRLHALEEIRQKADSIYKKLPDEEKDAFFQMVLLRIHGIYLTMCQYYFSDRSTLCQAQGKMQAAAVYAEETRSYEDAGRRMLYYYNHTLSKGKWNGILTPEDFPPPRTAMYPACTPPLSVGERRMLVHLWNDDERIRFSGPGTKWLEISNAGQGRFLYRIEAPEWVELSECQGEISHEKRILVSVAEEKEKKEGSIVIRNETDGTQHSVSVEVTPVLTECPYREDDGAIAIPVSGVWAEGFRMIAGLGREEGNLLEGFREGAELTFPVYAESQGEFLLEIHRFPSLNSTGRLRIGVRFDQGDMQIAESMANDEWRDTWERNTADNVDKIYVRLPWADCGEHSLTVRVIDRYFAFSRIVIYTKQRKENNLGLIQGKQALPAVGLVRKWSEDFYGEVPLKPRKEIFAIKTAAKDTLIVTDRFVEAERYAETRRPEEILKAAEGPFHEKNEMIKIDAFTAYARTEYAYTTGENWQYCSSESYGRSGLALYIRKRGQRWDGLETAPALHYRLVCEGGTYCFWILVRIDPADPSFLAAAVDGAPVEKERLYNEGKLWRYEAEQVWRWVPFAGLELTPGEHLLTVAAMASGIRLDRFCLMRGDGLPPTDLYW